MHHVRRCVKKDFVPIGSLLALRLLCWRLCCAVLTKGMSELHFENVGGPIFDAVLPLLNNFARIPVCGRIAHYNTAGLRPGPDHLPLLMRAILTKRPMLRGFIYFDYASQLPDFVTDMQAWLAEGRMKYREDLTDRLENAPRELIRLLKGQNFGKKIIRVSPDPTAIK
jgi:NADPH-dependent curcumin reductase CurA